MDKIDIKFDPLAWVKKEEANSSQSRAEDRAYSPMSESYEDDELGKAQAVCDELIARGANIAESYHDYLRLGFSLAQLGSQGHDIYHALCSLSAKYRQNDCEKKWRECLSKKRGSVTIATFYKMAKDAGVNLKVVFARHYQLNENYNI